LPTHLTLARQRLPAYITSSFIYHVIPLEADFRFAPTRLTEPIIMSLHTSLKGSTKIRERRNVLKRFERIDKLAKEGKWKKGDDVLGLPKTKIE
jgi:small basic protein (TIGR04137 family)